jgi:hypothetical protein
LTTSSFSLAHAQDIETITTGTHILYVYGRARFIDIEANVHELHFCRYYKPVLGGEPLKLNLCSSYNETVDF